MSRKNFMDGLEGRILFSEILFLASVFFAGLFIFKFIATGSSAGKSGNIYGKINLFTEVIKKVSDNYVEEISDEELIMRAIKWMVHSLDPFSAYMSPDELKEMEVETKGQFGGLGIEITKKDYYILVISPIEDTPAWRAGILPGDRIIKINGEPTRDMTLLEAVKKLRGPRGTKVVITVERDGWEEPKDIEIIRDIIKIKSVKSKVIDGDILYIRLSSFQEGSSKEILDAFRKSGLYKGKIKGVIFDLRNNPGGLLSEAIRIGDIFISEGVIVSTKGRRYSRDYTARKQSYDFPGGVSLIVLVNRGSASASEIVSGAIKDHKKGVLVGTRTFGKASVQTIIPLSNGGALRLTTAHYYTPAGTNIEEKGIKPNIIFKPKRKPVRIADLSPKQILERRKHPEWDEAVQFALSLIKSEKVKSEDKEKAKKKSD